MPTYGYGKTTRGRRSLRYGALSMRHRKAGGYYKSQIAMRRIQAASARGNWAYPVRNVPRVKSELPGGEARHLAMIRRIRRYDPALPSKFPSLPMSVRYNYLKRWGLLRDYNKRFPQYKVTKPRKGGKREALVDAYGPGIKMGKRRGKVTSFTGPGGYGRITEV